LEGQRDADEVITQLRAELDEERVGRLEDQQVIGEDLMRVIDEQGALQSEVESSLADAVTRLRLSEDHRQQSGLERDALAGEVADMRAAHAECVKQFAAERVEMQERLDAEVDTHSRFVAHTQAEQLAQGAELVQQNDVVQALTAARQEIEMDASGLRMQLTETLARAEVAETRLAALQEHGTEDRARSEALESKNGELYNNFCSLEIEVGHLKGSVEALQAHKHSAMEREAELEDRLRTQQTSVLELERQLAEDHDGFSRRESELLSGMALAEDIQSSVQSDLKASLAEKEAALSEAHAATDAMRSSLSELETCAAAAEAEVVDLRAEMASLREEGGQRDADYDKLQAEYVGLQGSLAAQKSVAEESGGQVVELKHSVNRLLEDLHFATHVEGVEKDRQLAATKARNEELAAELQTAQLTEVEAARQCRETDVALASAVEQEHALRALVLTSVGAAGAEVAVLKQQAAGLREENTALQHAFAEMQARLGGVMRGMCAAAAAKETAFARLSAELEKTEVSCATGDRALSELRAECSRMELENSELTKRCIELQSHVHDADAAAAESDEALTAVTDDKVRVSQLLDEAEGRAQDLMVDVADANDAIADLQMQIQALRQEKEEEAGRARDLVNQEVQSRMQQEQCVVRIAADMDFERNRAEALSLTLKESEAREELAAHSVEGLRGDLDEAQSKCACLATEVTQLTGRLQARAEESGATLAGMEERVLMLKRELDDRGEEARVDRAALMTQYEEMLESARADHALLVTSMQQDFGVEREVFEQSLAEVTAAAQEGDGAKVALVAREKLIDDLKRNAHALAREKRAIETALAKSKTYVDELKTELAGLTTAHKLAVTAAKNKEKRFIEEMDAARAAHTSDRDALCLASSEEVARLHDEHADALAASKNELEDFRGRATTAYMQLEHASSARVAEVTEQMQGEAEKKQTYIADIEEQLDTYQNEMEANRSRLTSMRETLQMQQDALEAAEQREAEYHTNLAQVEQSSRSAIAQVVSVEETMAEMSRVLGCTRAENVELQQLVMDKKVELEALHATLNNFVNDNVTPEKEALLAGNLSSPRQAKDEAGWRVEKNKRRLAILMEWHQEIMQVSCALHERCTFALALDTDNAATAPAVSTSAATASLMNISRTYHDLSVRLAMAPWINSNSRRNKLQPMLAPHEMVQQMQGGSDSGNGHSAPVQKSGSEPLTSASSSASITSSTNASAGCAPSEVTVSTESLCSSVDSVGDGGGGSRESHDMGKIATYLKGVSSMRERSNRVQDEVVVSRAEHEVRKLSEGMEGRGQPVQRTPRQSPGRAAHSGLALPSPDAHMVAAANDAWDEEEDFFNLSADSARSD
jgi:chromosome segregation ATPase